MIKRCYYCGQEILLYGRFFGGTEWRHMLSESRQCNLYATPRG